VVKIGNLEIFITSFVVAFSGAIMPGPMLTATIAESSKRGIKAGPLIVLGHGILEIILILALAIGMASILTQGAIIRAVALVGGAFLVFLGFTMCRDALQERVDAADIFGGKRENKGFHPVLSGIFVSLSNPYWTIWWATVGLSYITLSLKKGGGGLASFFFGHILADLLWFTFIAAVVAGGSRFFSQKIYSYLISVCGLLLIGLGVYFIISGLRGF